MVLRLYKLSLFGGLLIRPDCVTMVLLLAWGLVWGAVGFAQVIGGVMGLVGGLGSG